MNTQAWLLIGLIGMALGSIAIFAKGKRRTPEEETHTIVSGTVTLIATVSYFAMYTGQGFVQLMDSNGAVRDFYFARYVDWLFTTPLLLLALAYTAMPTGLRRRGMIFGMIGADVLMIVTSLLFGFSHTEAVRWTWFIFSCGAFLGVYYVMFGPLAEEARKSGVATARVYQRNAVALAVIWFLYPVVLAVSDDGLAIIGLGATTAFIAVLDLVAKVVYGYFTVTEEASLTDDRVGAETPVPATARG